MTKTEAKQKLGGTLSSMARACGVSLSAVKQWPENLTRRNIDTVQAAILRQIQEKVR